MATQPLNIILTNDDGYNAPGITTLYNALVAAGNNVHIVAPAANQTAQGSSLGGTTALSNPFAITQFSPGNYYVDGRPATTALVGLDDFGTSLFGGSPADLVISGTNRGDNIGESENISGTVNGALQGLFEGVPAIAVSAGSANGSYDAGFANAGTFTADFVAKLSEARAPGAPLLPAGEALTINVPGTATPTGVAVTTITAESPASYPYMQNANGTYSEVFTPNTTSLGSPTAEGSQFLLNRITVSPIDGNFGATEAVRETLAARLSGNLAGTAPAAAPLNILLMDEDGYGSAGITATRQALLAKGYNVTVLAPSTDQSGVGSALDLTALTVTTYDSKNYASTGTPASLVALALDPQGLLRGMPKPDLVVVGADVGNAVGIENANHSATLGAAITALFNYGVPSIALTSAGGGTADLATSADFVTKVIANLQATQGSATSILPAGTGLSINVPTGATEANYAFTNIDKATNANLSVTGSATQAAYVVGGAVTSTAPNSEGMAFQAGKITISPIDATIASTDSTFYTALAGLLGTTYGTPSTGFSVQTDASTGGHLIDLVVPSALTAAQGTSAVDTAVYDGFGLLTLPANIENAALTNAGSLVGNALNNLLTGVGGNHISAGDGNDIVVGAGTGNVLDGGAGNDTVVLDFKLADTTVSFANGYVVLTAPGAQEQVKNFEHYQFTDAYVDQSTAAAQPFAYGHAPLDITVGNHVIEAGAASADTVVGTAGIDTVSYATSATHVSIDLGAQSTWNGSVNDTLASIENATGSRFDDTLVGDSHHNVLDGGAGGADLIIGGDGDTVSHASSLTAVSIDLGAQLTWDGSVNDHLAGIENAIGSGFNDTLVGDGADNVLDGGAGGADLINGGSGTDTVSYAASAATGGIVVDLGAHSTWDGTSNDTLVSIENAIGSKGNDVIVGDAGNNVLDGGAGGADQISGGTGTDTVSYAASTSAVSIDLSRQLTWDGTVNDRLSSIENAIGSHFNDTLTAGSGSSVLTGNGGTDTFVFKAGFGHDAVTDFVAGGQSHDILQFDHGLFANDDVLAAAQDVGSNVVFVAPGHDGSALVGQSDLTLFGVHKADLSLADFHFV